MHFVARIRRTTDSFRVSGLRLQSRKGTALGDIHSEERPGMIIFDAKEAASLSIDEWSHSNHHVLYPPAKAKRKRPVIATRVAVFKSK